MSDNEATFTIDLIGDTTKDRKTGKFKVKKRLSHRDTIALDNYRRNLLGPNPDSASPRAASIAFVSADLSVRILDAPTWWKESDGGLELEDDNVLKEIHDKSLMIEKDAYDALHKQAEEAVEPIKEAIKEANKI